MPFNILLLPLLGGFIFVSRWHRTRWYSRRAEKERLLFHSALAGLAFLSAAFFITHIPPPIPCVDGFWCFPAWWREHCPLPHTGLSILAFALGAISWIPLNAEWCDNFTRSIPQKVTWLGRFIESSNRIRDSYNAEIIDKEGSELERLLDTAMRQEKHVLITLKGGKVYVGRVGRLPAPKEPDKGIFLLPTKSGYREKDKQRLEFTTNYDEAYEGIKSDYPNDYNEIIKDFGIVIMTDEIVTVSFYNYMVHADYFPHTPQPSLAFDDD